ncbi:MAG: methyltransferase [Proteobacteria bacterium]|nr:methyltransferase [Pseudomonadota bacterium]
MQVATAQPPVESIRAGLNYIVDTGVPPAVYVDWPEMAHLANPPRYERREVTLRDGRRLRDNFRLDTHGFAFTDHDTRMADFSDQDELARVYEPEVQALVKKRSGASDVLVFDHTIRIGDDAARASANARAPVKGVHNDYTENSAPQRLRDILGAAEAERRMRNRFAIIQVWRPIRGTVTIDPLAICDARSIPQEGFILLQRRYPHRIAEVYHIAYHPAHAWFYFPRMQRHEALVFKVFDSDARQPARFTAHTAFDDPGTPADASPRESIETRTFAFFD